MCHHKKLKILLSSILGIGLLSIILIFFLQNSLKINLFSKFRESTQETKENSINTESSIAEEAEPSQTSQSESKTSDNKDDDSNKSTIEDQETTSTTESTTTPTPNPQSNSSTPSLSSPVKTQSSQNNSEQVLNCNESLAMEYSQQYCNNLVAGDDFSSMASSTLHNASSYCTSLYMTPPVYNFDGWSNCMQTQTNNANTYSNEAKSYYSSAQKYKELLLGCGFTSDNISTINTKCQ